jgi:hypothetical protein
MSSSRADQGAFYYMNYVSNSNIEANKPRSAEFVVGAFLFFGAGPLNWLNSLSTEKIKEDISQIKMEGFNHLFLVVPWAEILFDDCRKARSTLLQVLTEAASQNIGVFLRLCYPWESGRKPESSFNLLVDWPFSPRTQAQLREYLTIIRTLSSRTNGKIRYFVSWEDLYWSMYRNWEHETPVRRKYLADPSGFSTFLDLLNAKDVPREIPPYNTEHSILFASFVDNIITPRFLNAVRQELGDVGFEYRIDSDQVGYIDNSHSVPNYYHWSRSQPYCAKKFIYFHQHVGSPDEKELSAQSAIGNLEWLLRTTAPLRNAGEQLPLIDQFNFIDSTDRIYAVVPNEKGELASFLNQSLALLGKQSSGLALWGYHDWAKDIIFNGRFNFGLDGWDCSDSWVSHVDGHCRLNAGGMISQTLQLELSAESDWICLVAVENMQDEEAEITVSLGDAVVRHQIPCRFSGTINTEIPPVNQGKLVITCMVTHISLISVKLFDRIYSQGGKQDQSTHTASFNCFLDAMSSLHTNVS